MSDISEKEAGTKLRNLGFSSAWGCKDGVFISSEDAFKLIRLAKILGVVSVDRKKSSENDTSGKGAYEKEIKPLDLG